MRLIEHMDACTHAQLKRLLGKLHNSQPQAERAQPVASPRISVCKTDEARGLYIGCMRTIDEIAPWSTMNNVARLAVWKTSSEYVCAWFNDASCA